jgi:hypothetical protein
MYFCRHCEADRSQSPLKALDFEAVATATHFLVLLEKFSELVDELTCSRSSPCQRLGSCNPGAVATPRRPRHAGPRRPCLTAQGRTRHVLPAVWIPLFLGSPGKETAAVGWGRRLGLEAPEIGPIQLAGPRAQAFRIWLVHNTKYLGRAGVLIKYLGRVRISSCLTHQAALPQDPGGTLGADRLGKQVKM